MLGANEDTSKFAFDSSNCFLRCTTMTRNYKAEHVENRTFAIERLVVLVPKEIYVSEIKKTFSTKLAKWFLSNTLRALSLQSINTTGDFSIGHSPCLSQTHDASKSGRV